MCPLQAVIVRVSEVESYSSQLAGYLHLCADSRCILVICLMHAAMHADSNAKHFA